MFPFHEACYTILARALYNDPDTTRIDKDALYTTIILHEQVDGRYNSLSLDYGHFDNSEQFWLSNAGYEVRFVMSHYCAFSSACYSNKAKAAN